VRNERMLAYSQTECSCGKISYPDNSLKEGSQKIASRAYHFNLLDIVSFLLFQYLPDIQ